MDDAVFDAFSIVSLSPFPRWLLALGVVAAIAGVVAAIVGLRTERVRWRWGLLASLRVAFGLAVLGFFLEPGVRDLKMSRSRSRLAVLVDRSASMAVASSGGRTRAAEAQDAVKRLEADVARLRGRYALDLELFSNDVGPFSAEALAAPDGPSTDVIGAIASTAQRDEARKLGGILVVSDGAENVEADPAAAVARLTKYGVPVSTIAVGADDLSDVAIDDVRVDEFAFVRSSVTVEATVSGRGTRFGSVPVLLKREGQVVATSNANLDSAGAQAKVTFTFTPDRTGRAGYSIAVPVQPGEVVAENNVRPFVLRVIRDRVRVLLVVGRPTWDERFLRAQLKQDPNVELISFYILRTNTDIGDPPVDEQELALIPFPMEEIFDTKLGTFDAVIFQNFGYSEAELRVAYYEPNLLRYVKNGGALVVIGGDRSFGEARYPFNTLGEAIPLETAGPADVAPFRPRATATALSHPVLQLSERGETLQSVLANLPELIGTNVTRARPGATVLLEHPFARAQESNAPLLALWEYGRGRVIALASDSTWRWAFASNAAGAPSHSYARFWSNALRWLTRDPELTSLSLVPDAAQFEPVQKIGAVATVRGADFRPMPDADVVAELVEVEAQKVVERITTKTGNDGAARLEFAAAPIGVYRLHVVARLGERELGTADDSIAVTARDPERGDLRTNHALLRQIADATGGKFRFAADASLDVPLNEPPLQEIGRSADRPVWDRWWWFVLAVALAAAEWVARRRFGFI